MKNNVKLLFILIIYTQFNFQIIGQESDLFFEQIYNENGFSQSMISNVEQTEDGFIWLGTDNGLVKYDGYNFIRYVHDKKEELTISNNHVNFLFEDNNKNLWVGTNHGLNLFNKRTSNFSRIDIQDSKGGRNYISCIIQDDKFNLLVGTFGGVKYFNPKTNLLQDLSKDANSFFKNCRVLTLFNDKNYGVFVGTSKGLFCLNPDNGDSIELPNILKSNDIFKNSKIWKIVKEENGDLWFATETNGIFLYSKNKNRLINYRYNNENKNSLAANWVNDILIKDKNTIWFATKSGLSVFNKKNEYFTNYTHNPFLNYSLTDNDLKCFFKDKSGSIWIGTIAGGLNFYNKANSNFVNINETIKPYFGLNNPIVNGVIEDLDGTLWIGTYGGGLNYLDFKNKRSIYYSLNTEDGKVVSNLFTVVAKKNEDIILCGTFNGLYEFNKKSKNFKTIKLSNEEKVDERPITSISIDGSDIWVGTNGNGLKKVSKNGIIENYLSDGQVNTLSDNFITDIESRDDGLWIATQYGLNYFDKKLKKVTKLYLYKEENSISSNTLTSLFTDSKGRLWIGTDYNGLNYFDETTEKFYVINNSLGLKDGVIKSISEDNEGNLWVSSEDLLYKIKILDFKFPFTINSFEIISYSSSEGLNTKQFSPNCSLKTITNKMVFGGSNGLVVFSPENLLKLPNTNEIVFTKLIVNNEIIEVGQENAILQNNISETSEITLNHKQGYIGIEFSALNYVKTESINYAYQLRKSKNDDKWQEIGKQHLINFTNLEPGDYTLRIKTSNEEGIWNPTIKSLKIIVLPPWWRTWWAYFIYFSFLITTLIIVLRIIKIRLKLKRELYFEHLENERQQELSQMKLEFFTNISHEFRTPLTLISGPVEELMNSVEKKSDIFGKLKTIKQNSDRLLKLINELMDFRKAEKGQMKIFCENQDIVPFCFEIYESFKGIAEEKNIDYKFVLNVHSIILHFDKNQMEKVLFNLLSNAFKFTKKNGKIIFSIELKGEPQNMVEIKIKDNGIGISEQSKKFLFTRFFQADDRGKHNIGSGIGLALSKSIVELHGGEISIPDEKDSWATTVFQISLKLGVEHLITEQIELVDEKFLINEKETSKDLVSYDNNGLEEDLLNEEPNNDGKKTILVVDDNKDVLTYLKDILIKTYRVLEFENAEEALQFMEKEIPDLIISDVMMPEMDGYELCRIVKTSQNTNHIPVILLTAKTSTDHRIEGLSTGADIYLTKPFSVEVLKLNITNLLASKEILRQKYSGSFIVDSNLEKLTTPEEIFIKKLMEIIELNMENPDFDVNELVSEIGMSRTVLYKKVQALTNHSVASLIKHLRIKKAADILVNTSYPVSEVTYIVGFNDRKHFSKEFKKVYNMSPTDYKLTYKTNK